MFFHLCEKMIENYIASILTYIYIYIQRELARQTSQVLQGFTDALERDGFPPLRVALCIGGVAVKEQMDVIKQ